MEEIRKILTELENNALVRSAVLISGKQNCFIAGADITELQQCKDEHSVYKISKDGQEILNRIAESKKPIIAAIQGVCFGGGLEVFILLVYILIKIKLIYILQIFNILFLYINLIYKYILIVK
jgi:enoyl-CoA hydratase/long-chain 3-hydroxyacyl-CoA dehydrogenase